MASQQKICVHIASYWKNKESYASRQPILVSVVNDYLALWDVKSMDIFIHTNSTEVIKTQFNVSDRLRVHYIVHDLSRENPKYLVWRPRELMIKQKDMFDVFVYLEDDIGIPFKALKYWLHYKDTLHVNNLDVGFVRVETQNKTDYFCSDVLLPSSHPMRIDDRIFVWNHQNYCAFWICDRYELERFIASPYWSPHLYFPNGINKPPSIFILESSAIGFKMSYLGSFYPLDDTNTLVSDMCFVHHLANNYIHAHDTPLGKFAVERMTEGLTLA